MTTEESDKTMRAKPLLDRVAIVTGAGQGMGRGIARGLARAGAHVVIAEAVVEPIAAAMALIEPLGAKWLGLHTDLSIAGDVRRMVPQSVQRFGQIGLLV